ncbi:hypothetical protein X777_12414 [Ooceraea biroi]|uniref:Uncharacterized protein n=1 Tax=Ooceraea biroi TaxID=2015173 RepID=A0A026VYT7_OOCBI|nr:hypothetical protein X777_12414 [Ooceraea biroi]
MKLTRPRLSPISKLLAVPPNELAAVLATASPAAAARFRLIKVTIHVPLEGSLLEVGSAAPDRGTAPASGSPLSLLYAVVEQAVAPNGGAQGHGSLVLFCNGGASLGRDGNGLADVPRTAVTPSSLLVLHGEPGSVISLVPLLLHSPQDTATPLKRQGKRLLSKVASRHFSCKNDQLIVKASYR